LPLYTAASTTDPLTRVWQGVNAHMGGVGRWVRGVGDAIRDFVDREYPDNALGEDRITLIPDLGIEPNFRHTFCSQARQGQLVIEEMALQHG
jgi:hypothetical protein